MQAIFALHGAVLRRVGGLEDECDTRGDAEQVLRRVGGLEGEM